MLLILISIFVLMLLWSINYLIYEIKYLNFLKYTIFYDVIFPIATIVCVITNIVLILSILLVPFNVNCKLNAYKAFKTTVEVARTGNLSELERVSIINKIIENNTIIEDHRAFHNSKWIGIWYSKQIADLEYIK